MLLVLALVVFFILLHYIEYVDDFIDRQAPMREIYLIYYPNYIPEIVRLISPLALFLACLYVTARMAQSLQIVALLTSGVPARRLMSPYIVFAVAVTGFMTVFNGWVVPETNRTVLKYDELYLKEAPRLIDKSNIHRQSGPQSVVTAGYYDRQSKTAYRVVLQRFNTNGSLVERLDAPRMQWQDSLWHLPTGARRQFGERIEQRSEVVELDTFLNVLPRDIARMETDIESMTIPVAHGYVRALRRSGAANTGRPEVGYYAKFAYPLANLVVVLLAFPLVIKRRRKGQTLQIGCGLLLAFGYLSVQKLFEPFGYAGELGPVFTAVAPHVLFLLIAAGMLLYARV